MVTPNDCLDSVGVRESTISALRKDEFNWGERYWEQRRAFATRSHAMRLNIVRYCNLCNNIIKILRFFGISFIKIGF